MNWRIIAIVGVVVTGAISALTYRHLNISGDPLATYRQSLALKSDVVALGDNPVAATGWNKLAAVCDACGFTDTAIAADERALRINPDFTKAWRDLGEIYKRIGRTEDAADAFQRARESNR